MYEDDACPRCKSTKETNHHVWECPEAKDPLDLIISNFLDQHNLGLDVTSDVQLAITALPTCHLVETIKQSSPVWTENSPPQQNSVVNEETRRNNALLVEHTSKMQRIVTKLISLGRDLVWKPRCDALIKHQRILGIFKNDKHPSRSTFRHADGATSAGENADGATSAGEISETPSGPRVRINPSSINKNFDPFRCSCGLHSLLHSPGRSCSQAGLITDRAKSLAFSAYRRQLKPVPLILCLP